MLTPDQIKAIEKEAEIFAAKGTSHTTEEGISHYKPIIKQSYIAGKTSGIEEAAVIAIAFGEWICSKGFDSKQICVSPIWSTGNGLNNFTTKELFNLFIKQYLKK